MKALIVILGMAVAAGCGSSEHVEKTQKLSYTYSFNGCETGTHEFASSEALCNGLQDDQLNRGCATDLRRVDFEKRCQGQSWNPS